MSTKLGSSAQWRQLLSSNSIVVADFYADWCGPCKMMAPTFEALATKHAKPGRIAFVKVDVDAHRDVASAHAVRAMPTFIVLRSGAAIDTIQGANPPALTAAVEKAVKLAGPGGAAGAGEGRTLGGAGAGAGRGRGARSLARPWNGRLNSLINAVVVFFGLYFTSLLSLDPYKAAENSSFNRVSPKPKAQESRPGGKPAARPAFKTMADL